jgi:tetraacyldisaccharide 4'-kinase
MNLPFGFRLLLWPLSVVYGAAARLNAWLYAQGVYSKKRLNAPVVSVGNLSVGGTGKTPMVLWLAEKFLASGKRVAILSRGYRGSGGTSDEIEMLRSRLGERVVFGVGPDRYAEGKRIESDRPVDVFLLDDGFQHLELARDVDILLVDATRPLDKDFLLPAGRLREPVSAVARASVVLFTRAHQTPAAPLAIEKFPTMPIFPVWTKLLSVRNVAGDQNAVLPCDLPQPVLAFCGIGNAQAFFEDVTRWGIAVAGKAAFRDHHSYSSHDIHELDTKAKDAKAKALLTTEKDVQNLGSANFELPLYRCEIAMDIPDEDEVLSLVTRLLSARVARPV